MHRLHAFLDKEDGHAPILIGPLIGAVGAVLLGVGAGNDNDGLAIAGGIVLAVGLLGGAFIRHMTMDWEMFRRTEK
ncbi:hypothetical protein EDM76_10560 [bacterium]|nr:MAG: hypothetical protein EDM76_10560 [bacterium]MCL4232791.1 hypothetical protein [Dehalococcoidia bacterium]